MYPAVAGVREAPHRVSGCGHRSLVIRTMGSMARRGSIRQYSIRQMFHSLLLACLADVCSERAGAEGGDDGRLRPRSAAFSGRGFYQWGAIAPRLSYWSCAPSVVPCTGTASGSATDSWLSIMQWQRPNDAMARGFTPRTCRTPLPSVGCGSPRRTELPRTRYSPSPTGLRRS
jgi:hypothetical protein